MFLSEELRRKIIYKKARQRAVEILTKEGFKVVGGSPNARTYEEAYRLVSNVDDQSITANLPKDALGDGHLLRDIIQWIKDHQDQILRIISIILSLAMLFLDEENHGS